MSNINAQAYKISGQMGRLLEGQRVDASGAAIGVVLAQFILLLATEDEEIDEGIQAIAEDAKVMARRLRNMRQ